MMNMDSVVSFLIPYKYSMYRYLNNIHQQTTMPTCFRTILNFKKNENREKFKGLFQERSGEEGSMKTVL